MMFGLDIGGTKMELAIFNERLERQDAWREATPKSNYQEFVATIAGMVAEADRKAGKRSSIGIGMPGFVDAKGYGVAANLPCINGKPLNLDIPERLGRPVAFENDVKAFILSEVEGGAAAGAERAIGIVLGTGLAAGLCINGELYRGRQNVAGEYGHIPLSAVVRQRYGLPLRACGCGLTACVERYLAGSGLTWLCEYTGSGYRDIATMLDGLRAGEERAEKVFSLYMDCLASFFAELTLILDPDVIVLGGGLSNVPEIYERVIPAMTRYLFNGVTAPGIVRPHFGDSSGVRGAALLGHRLSRQSQTR